MVGVPGSSKGCNTCRRRKIACDQQKPECDRCLRTGRKCEGYERPPGFLRRGQSSSSKAKTTASQATDTPDDLMSAFITMYQGDGSSSKVDPSYGWLDYVARHPAPPEPLRLARVALASNRTAFVKHDTQLAEQGKQAYIDALRELAKTLVADNVHGDDDTLAAAMCLETYELYESTSFKGWNSHILGVGHLLQGRGPDSLTSPIAQDIVRHFRAVNMYQCIQYRKSSFLIQPEWRLHVTPSNPRGLVMDIGVRIAALLEDFDRTVADGLFWNQYNMAQTYLDRCQSFVTELDDCYAAVIQQHAPSPVYWDATAGPSFLADPAQDSHLSELGSEEQVALEFPTATAALIMINLWALQLVISNTVALVIEKAADPARFAHVAAQHTEERTRGIARRIIRSVAFCIRDEMGLNGSTRPLFGIRIALIMLRACNAPELHWCELIYEHLVVAKGVGYGASLNSGLEGVWKEMEARRVK